VCVCAYVLLRDVWYVVRDTTTKTIVVVQLDCKLNESNESRLYTANRVL